MRPSGHRRSAGALALLILAALAAPATVNAGEATISINDVVVTETDNSANVDATFTLSLSGPVAHRVTVKYRTVNGPAAPAAGAIAPGDYTAIPLTLLAFAPNVTTRRVTVVVRGDRKDELHEGFSVALSSAVGATIADASGRGRILDNDPPPRLSVVDVTALEPTNPNGADAPMSFGVRLDRASGKTVVVDYATSHDTAQSPDYDPRIGSLTFPPGQTLMSVVVPIKSDTQDEIDETLDLTLSSPVNATLGDAVGVGTIDDNDGPGITIADRVVNELGIPNTLLFTVTLTAPSVQQVSVTYQTVGDTATAGSDFTAAGPATLTFAAGQTSKTIPVTINGDFAVEGDEVFDLALSAPVDGRIIDPDSQAQATLRNDDCAGTDPGPVSPVVLADVSGDSTGSGNITVATVIGLQRRG